jgi:hypothetical protein
MNEFDADSPIINKAILLSVLLGAFGIAIAAFAGHPANPPSVQRVTPTTVSASTQVADAKVVSSEVRFAESVASSADETAVSDTVQAEVATFEIGNGLRLARGQQLSAFKEQHPDSQCFESTIVGCEILNPDGADCPSVQQCDHVVYTFQEGKLDGFVVEYAGDIWRHFLSASTKQFGGSVHRVAHIGAMSVEGSRWKLTGGDGLLFTHYTGFDFNGNAIARPFSVQYGSDADAK